MVEFFEMVGGQALAFIGFALAVGLCCIGSAKGTGMVGEAATGVLSETPEHFTKCMILQALPGTQGLYGLAAGFFGLFTLGFFSGNPAQLSVGDGMAILFACVPIMLGGLLSAIAQGRVAAASVSAIVSKKPDDYMKGVIMCGIVEFYAILSLVGTILMLMYAL
mgnify:FL=1